MTALAHLRSYRLLDIVHADAKLYLVCEFLEVDLKRYMENCNKQGNPLTLELTKVSIAFRNLLYCPACRPATHHITTVRVVDACRES